MDAIKVCAFDPGITTGVVATMSTSPTEHMIISCGTLKYPGPMCEFLNTQFPKCDIYIVEQYRLYGHLAKQQAWSKLIPIRVIGAIELRIHQLGYQKRLIFQTAAQAKQLIDNAYLKAYDMWEGFSPHERDALRHIAAYTLKRRFPKRGR